ncbi:unnamed protein product [Paramecium octaurelia]|uniref:Uncharacterized protein n=1 Tax=Paramecium octaurelia TaxID=43137 RepID=A0A8S1T3S2_PAROT|nr:unnamed protein product [Paramecium octaurelia]
MGSGQSIKQRSLVSCLKFLIEDVELYADEKLLGYLGETYIKFSCNDQKKGQKLIKIIRKCIPLQIMQFEDVLLKDISSAFQYQLIANKSNNKQRQFQNYKLDSDFVRNFRLMNFEKLNLKYAGEYEDSLIQLYQGLKTYCNLADQIIKELKNNHLVQSQVYALIWEHFQNHLIQFSKDPFYDLNPINKIFDEKYYKLTPQLKIEIIGGKLWGCFVQQLDVHFILNEFRIARRSNNQKQIQFNHLFNSIIDMNIDVANVQWIGSSCFQFSDQLKDIIEFIQKDSQELMNNLYFESNGDLLEFFDKWKKDNIFLKSSIPQWICENYFDTLFFEFSEEKIKENFKLLSKVELQQIIEKYSYQEVRPDGMCIEQDFQQPLNSNFSQYDEYLYQNMEKILNKMIDWLKEENLLSDILLISESTQQGGSAAINYQDIHNCIFEENEYQVQRHSKQEVQSLIQYQLPVSNIMSGQEDRIVRICKKYNQVKNLIVSNIHYRDQNVQFRNRGMNSISNKLLDFFSFTKPVNENYCIEIINYLGNQKLIDKQLVNGAFQNGNMEQYQGSIAAQLLSLEK